jgi:hypothetical protein
MSGYIGNIPTPQATQSRQSFIATAGQTTFATVGYTAGFIDLYLNGVHLLDGTDYTATNGSDIVLTTGAALNDVVEFVAYETFSVFSQTFAGTVTADVLSVTGAATATDLTLSGDISANNLNLNTYSSGATNDRVALGVAISSTACFFLLPISGFVPPTGITVTGGFNVTTIGGSIVGGGSSTTPVDGGGSSNKMQHIQVSGLAVTAGNMYYLRAASAASVIEVNY